MTKNKKGRVRNRPHFLENALTRRCSGIASCLFLWLAGRPGGAVAVVRVVAVIRVINGGFFRRFTTCRGRRHCIHLLVLLGILPIVGFETAEKE
jgi:hypothetical protein